MFRVTAKALARFGAKLSYHTYREHQFPIGVAELIEDKSRERGRDAEVALVEPWSFSCIHALQDIQAPAYQMAILKR